MLYINFILILSILFFNYKLLFYIGFFYIAYMMFNTCLLNNYWTNSTDYSMRLFGNFVYLVHYTIYKYQNSYLFNIIYNIYMFIYSSFQYIDSIICNTIKRKVISYIFCKPKQQLTTNQIADMEINNILQSNLKLILYVENSNLYTNDNELKQFLKQSKIKINTFMKKYIKKPTNILDDIKKNNI